MCEVAALAHPGDTGGVLGSGFLVDGARRVATARHVMHPDGLAVTGPSETDLW